MPVSYSVSSSLSSLESVWSLSDALFTRSITAARSLSRPISLRNPFSFYLGHLPSFTWNTLRPVLQAPPLHPVFDALFSRGIDPDVEDPSNCHDHPPPPAKWPHWDQIIKYAHDVRAAVRKAAAERSADDTLARVLHIIAEHEAMHIETLYYMLAQTQRHTPRCCERTATSLDPRSTEPGPAPVHWVYVPAAVVPLGVPSGKAFRWDNEQNSAKTSVPAFRIAREAVSVADFLRFVRARGYQKKQLWGEEDWNWVCREELRHPMSWDCAGRDLAGEDFTVLTGVGPGMEEHEKEYCFDDMLQWPASVSLAEARAYAKWCGATLATEAQWLLAAYGEEGAAKEEGVGMEEHEKEYCFDDMLQWPASVSLAEARAYAKWCGATLATEAQWLLAAYGEEGAAKEEGVVEVMRGRPHAVTMGRMAACGAVGMVGNGWELTTTLLAEFDGFMPTPEYPEYTADFFDDKHFVLKGASWATHSLIVRPSFCNFYQARYPFVFSKFRLVVPGDPGV